MKAKIVPILYIGEFWRCNGETWRIYFLRGSEYVEVEISPTFAMVSRTKFYEFLADARVSEIKADQTLRRWMRHASV